MGRTSKSVIAYYGVLSKRNANRDYLEQILSARCTSCSNGACYTYLLGKAIHVLSYFIIACWMEQDWEAPRISESNQVRFSREEVDIEYPELSNLLPCHC